MYTYVYIYIHRERERERERDLAVRRIPNKSNYLLEGFICLTQQTCLRCDAADNVCCLAKQTCLVWKSRHVRCVRQQTCLLCDTADMPPLACDTKPWFCVAGGGGGGLPRKLDLNTCLTPEAQNWTDLNYIL